MRRREPSRAAAPASGLIAAPPASRCRHRHAQVAAADGVLLRVVGVASRRTHAGCLESRAGRGPGPGRALATGPAPGAATGWRRRGGAPAAGRGGAAARLRITERESGWSGSEIGPTAPQAGPRRRPGPRLRPQFRAFAATLPLLLDAAELVVVARSVSPAARLVCRTGFCIDKLWFFVVGPVVIDVFVSPHPSPTRIRLRGSSCCGSSFVRLAARSFAA